MCKGRQMRMRVVPRDSKLLHLAGTRCCRPFTNALHVTSPLLLPQLSGVLQSHIKDIVEMASFCFCNANDPAWVATAGIWFEALAHMSMPACCYCRCAEYSARRMGLQRSPSHCPIAPKALHLCARPFLDLLTWSQTAESIAAARSG